MNRKDLIESISAKSGLSKKDSEVALKALIESIEETVVAGDKVALVGFGTFEPRDRSERVGRNPKTGSEILIPATRVPVFKAGTNFKDRVAGRK